MAGGADIILLPEIPFKLGKDRRGGPNRDAQWYLSTMIVVAEGASPKDGEKLVYESSTIGENRLGGIGEIVARDVAGRTGKETRCCVLGHLQRGGAPTTIDRLLGTRFGVKAVKLIAERKFGINGELQERSNPRLCQLPMRFNRLRYVDPNYQLVETAREIGISFGD